LPAPTSRDRLARDIHIPFTRAGLVLTLLSLVVGTGFAIASWFSKHPQLRKFEVTVVYAGLDVWVLWVFVVGAFFS